MIWIIHNWFEVFLAECLTSSNSIADNTVQHNSVHYRQHDIKSSKYTAQNCLMLLKI